MSVSDSLEVKVTIGNEVRQMKESPGYKEMMKRIEERCGKFFHGWILANDEKAKQLREMAKGYFAFDQLADQVIHEGETAREMLKGTIQSSPR